MTLRALGGLVEIVRGDERIKVDGEKSLEALDVVITDGKGSAKLRLEGDRSLDLSADSRLTVIDGWSVEGEKGNLLAHANSDPLSVRFGEVTAAATDAVFRVDQGIVSSRAAAYQGQIELGVPGEPRMQLDPYYEAEVAGGIDLPSSTSPYSLNSRDAWDRKHFRHVVDLQSRLQNLDQDLTSFVGKARPGLSFFEQLAAQPVGFVAPEIKKRRAADLLTGFLIAQNTPKGSLKDQFRRAFRLFDEGAAWSVVAAIMQARIGQLVAELTDVVKVTRIAVKKSGGNEIVFAAPGGVVDESISGPGGPGSTIGPSTKPTTGPTKKPTAGPKPTNSPSPECDNTAECAVNEVLGDDPSPDPSPSSSAKGGVLKDVPG